MFLIPASYWQVKKIKNKGRGVFAKKEILSGTVIGDYLGKIVRASTLKESPIKFYAMEYNKSAVILPDLKKTGIHLFNHSCSPNCAMRYYNGHMLFFALRRIFVGEELTISYLFENDFCDDATCLQHECHCGSPVCRGTMHTPHRIIKNWEDGQRKNYRKNLTAPYGIWLLPLKKYPKVIKDFGANEVFGSWDKRPLSCLDRQVPSLAEIKKKIYQSGRRLDFESINLVVDGVSGDIIIASK